MSFSFSEGGCAIRKEVFDKVGLFWERLFFGSEGMELSLRVLDAGYDILFYPKSLIYHRASPHARFEGGKREEMTFNHSLLVYLMRYPWWMLMFFLPTKTTAVFFRGLRRGYFKFVFRGFITFLLQVPTILKERDPIQNKTALNYIQLLRQHGPLSWNLSSWLKHKA